jgi:glutamate--cysteine ligase catalytic subunit
MSSGDLLTPAAWIRNFVRSHPAYKGDSVVSQEINYDLMVAVDEMCVHSALFIAQHVLTKFLSSRERGVRKAPELLPEDYNGGDYARVDKETPAPEPASPRIKKKRQSSGSCVLA